MKQIIVVRTDLGMSPGKIAAQVAHAAGYLYHEACNDARFNEWFAEGEKIVVLKVDSLVALQYQLQKANRMFKVLVHSVTDRDLNQMTCFGCGPHKEDAMDVAFGELKLL